MLKIIIFQNNLDFIGSIPGSSVRFPVKCGGSAGSGESAGWIGSGGGVRAGTRSSGGRGPLSSSLDSLLKRIHSSNLRNKPNSSKTRHSCPAKEMILCNKQSLENRKKLVF